MYLCARRMTNIFVILSPEGTKNLLSMDKNGYVYILTNKRHNVLYIGVTNNLVKRIYEHKEKFVEGFTKKYNVDSLVYYEVYEGNESIVEAIKREKQIKGWLRRKKVALIEERNPKWEDLYWKII